MSNNGAVASHSQGMPNFRRYIRIPPGNRLEVLTGDRQGQHSIRVNDQWRVCFAWRDDNVFDVEIVDYH